MISIQAHCPEHLVHKVASASNTWQCCSTFGSLEGSQANNASWCRTRTGYYKARDYQHTNKPLAGMRQWMTYIWFEGCTRSSKNLLACLSSQHAQWKLRRHRGSKKKHDTYINLHNCWVSKPNHPAHR